MKKGAALYMRISREDEKNRESSSVSTQRKIIASYAKEKGLAVYNEYVDDGFSGTDFDRPAFGGMLEDIERGLIDTVIVKDLSRLGRNSARTSDLLDEYFPRRGVRFISVTEGIDTAARSASVMLAPLTNAINEIYARDISNKIRCALEAKIKNGEYIGSFPPYGYKKDPKDKNRLIINRQLAPVVKTIFEMAASGLSRARIAEKLNQRKVPPPSAYTVGKGGIWKPRGVGKLLENIAYVGDTAQGKSIRPSFKSKKSMPVSRGEWTVVKNTHEPIIDRELWSQVRRKKSMPREKSFLNIFAGLAVCADCKSKMSSVGTRKKGSPACLACGRYKRLGKKACTNHHIHYNTLYNAVWEALKKRGQAAETLTADSARRQIRSIEIEQGIYHAGCKTQKIRIFFSSPPECEELEIKE